MWFAVRGNLVANYSNLNLRHPKGDYTDLKLGPLHVKSLVPNLSRAVSAKHGDANCKVTFTAFQKKPIVLRPKKGDGYFSEISSDGHYESIGTVSGTIKVGGEVIPINGFGYDDRSWGIRKWDNMHYRILGACFGPDLYMCVYHVATHTGASDFGWVFDGGEFHELRSVDFEMHVNQDGLTARGGKVRVWTEDGRGYAVNVSCDGNSVINQRDNFMASPALSVCEMGGRLGVGLLEFAELKRPTPALIEKYGLDIAD